MGIEQKYEFVDSKTNQALDLMACPCGNKSFYKAYDERVFCASCLMTFTESQTQEDNNV